MKKLLSLLLLLIPLLVSGQYLDPRRLGRNNPTNGKFLQIGSDSKAYWLMPVTSTSDSTYSLASTGFVRSIAYKKTGFAEVVSYAAMLALPYSNVMIEVKVSVDEDKGGNNTIYHIWPSGKRQWLAVLDDN